MNSPNDDKPAFFDAYSDRYDEAVNKAIAFSGLEVDFFVRVKAAYMQDILVDYFEDTSQVDLLDVGCRVGNYHKYWINNVRSLHGVDVSAMSIARASERNPSVRYKVYDGDKLPFADKTFDSAVAICVMHHVTPIKRPSFATELRRVMKRGGLL